MPLPSFPLVKWFAAAEGRFDISLSHSDCEPLQVSDLLDGAELQSFAGFGLGYGSFAGSDDLRNLVAEQYKTIGSDDVLVFSGASEAIYSFMRSTLSPGDEVIVQNPIFGSLKATAQGIGCKIVDWHARDEMTNAFDPSTLVELCSSRTKLIVFNFPHNPSGQMISESDLQLICDAARQSDAFVFSDEQFRLLELPGTATLPAACDLYDKAVSVTGVSKTHGLGGLRIGWLATRCQSVINQAREYRYYTTEMTNTPCQFLAARALKQSESIIQRNRDLIASNADLLRDFADQHKDKLVMHEPQAGTMALIEQRTSLTGTQFCDRLLDDQRVFLVPGAVMGIPDRLLRFGLGRADLAEGLERVGRFLAASS